MLDFHKMWYRLAVMAGLGLAASSAIAQEATAPPTAAPPPAAATQPGKPPEPPEYPDFIETTKDMQVKEGFLTLYYNPKTDKLLATIPMSMLDKRFYMASSISSGREFAGWQWIDGVFYWQRFDKKLILNYADPRYSRGKGSTVEDVIGRTYVDPIAAALDIVTQTPSGDPVVDFAPFLKSDAAGVSMLYGPVRIDPGLSRFQAVKAFPKNLELNVELALSGGGFGNSGGAERIAVHYSIAELPETAYQPRQADDRIGYFMVVNKDWSKPHLEKTVFNRYITRWWLEPENPEAAVSDVKPEHQIVFYIEKTVPIELRPHVRDGILEWNKAFEKAGLRNAVRVIQQTDSDPETKDIDPEDARYNFFRWIVSGQAYAMGPSRAHPFTGQILDADIVFDDAMMRWMVNEYRTMGPRPQAAYEEPDLQEFLTQFPEWQPDSLIEKWMPENANKPWLLQDESAAPQRFGWHTQAKLRAMGKCTCEYGIGAVRQLALGAAVNAQAGLGGLSDKFIGQVIKEVVAHEVGHTLGLRHNFKASAWKGLSEITSNRNPDEPNVGSVMDYNPSIFAVTEADQGNFTTPAIGPYDFWAIEYGYRQVPKDGKEPDILKAVTNKVAEAGMDYLTDEDTMFFSPDPLSNRFDNGRDPMEFARDRVALYQRLMKDCETWAVEDGESWSRLRRVVDMLLGEYESGMIVASRLIGGQYIHRDHKADPDARPPFVIVPAQTQRSAMQLLGEFVFAENAFSFSPELLNKLAAGRWGHWDSDSFDLFVEYDVHERVLGMQSWILFRLMNPFTLNRIYDAQLKVPASVEAVTVSEVLNTLGDMVWSELNNAGKKGKYTNADPFISSFRRNLQRAYTENLSQLILGADRLPIAGDCCAVATATLRNLGERIGKVLEGSRTGLDDYSRAHLDDVKQRITQVLEAKYRLN